jgi:Uri superfamily endonuclease
MFEETIASMPKETGSYALWLYLAQAQTIQIGRLGNFSFPARDYVCLGSACGSGGLRSRLGRHLRGDGETHWHIDYLRRVAVVKGFLYTICRGDSRIAPTECTWSQTLATHPEVSIPAPGFGASDCKSGCEAHLVRLTDAGLLTSIQGVYVRVPTQHAPPHIPPPFSESTFLQ